MKKHLLVYAMLVVIFIIYNFFFEIKDTRINTAVNILAASILFGYIAYMAFILYRKIGKNK